MSDIYYKNKYLNLSSNYENNITKISTLEDEIYILKKTNIDSQILSDELKNKLPHTNDSILHKSLKDTIKTNNNNILNNISIILEKNKEIKQLKQNQSKCPYKSSS